MNNLPLNGNLREAHSEYLTNSLHAISSPLSYESKITNTRWIRVPKELGKMMNSD